MSSAYLESRKKALKGLGAHSTRCTDRARHTPIAIDKVRQQKSLRDLVAVVNVPDLMAGEVRR